MATALSSLISSGLSSGSASSGSSASGSSTYAGLGQGINVSNAVQAAEADQQAYITNVENQQAAVQQQSSALATIASDLQAVQTAASALQDPLGVLADQTATSSNTGELNATATSSAVAGQHTISITNLATTSSYYSDAVATGDTPLATGDTITVTVGGQPTVSITTNSSDNTLNQLAAEINGDTSAVNASVITDANGARLAIVSATSGAPGNITISGTLHDTNGNAIHFNQAVQGQNAQLTVDGVPISSTSNAVTGALNGVTLNLAAPTGNAPVTVTVAPDTTSITSAITSFVNAYNTAVSDINAQYQVTSTSSGTSAPPLLSDGSLSDAQAQLLNAATYSLQEDGSAVNLASLGISTNDDGTLSIDQNQLTAALQSNYSSVQNFFQTAGTGFATNIGNVLTNLIGGNGELTLDAQQYTGQSNDLSQQISDLQAQLALQTQTLTTTYAQVNTTLEELPLLQSQLSQQLSSIS